MIDLPYRITRSWLESKRACYDGLEKFQGLFPNGVHPSVEALNKFPAADIRWLAESLFQGNDYNTYLEQHKNLNEELRDKRNTINRLRNELYTLTTGEFQKVFEGTSLGNLKNSISYDAELSLEKAHNEYKSKLSKLVFDIAVGNL